MLCHVLLCFVCGVLPRSPALRAAARCCVLCRGVWRCALLLCTAPLGTVMCLAALRCLFCGVQPGIVLLWAVVYSVVSFGVVWHYGVSCFVV